jgi:ABC-type enterochelin transport system substrate-binding protein
MERVETNMRRTSIAIAAIACILTFGCKNQASQSSASSSDTAAPTSVAAQTNLTPEDLGELGAKIKKNPSDAQKLLSEKGLTEQSFEHAIRKVAESPEESKRYAAAYKKASA